MGNTPNIRFKGFTDDWEQRKLGEIVERVTRKNQDLVSELPLTISAQYGLIDQNEFFDKRVASKDVSGYYLIYNGEFAYNKSTSSDAPWGAIKRLDRYENGVLSTLYIVFRIKNEDILNSDFLMNYYDTNNWHKDIQAIASEGARNHGLLNIAPADFFETELMLPQDIEEQKNIGNYFKSLNNLITLHQRKCDETKKLKKFMLQKMFPKKDAKKPEIRFAGFTNDWEQRKLMEVAEYRNGKAHENEINDDGEYIVVNSKFVSTNGEIRKFSYAQNEPLYENEIAFVLSDVPNGRAIARTFLVDKSGKYTLNQRIAGITPHEDTDPYYLYIKMNRNEYFLKFDDGNKQTNLSIKDVLNYEDMYPSYKEQQKIGMYFQQLDHLITLHQRKSFLYFSRINDWEQRKLNEVAEFNPKSELPDEFEYVDLESVVGTEMISHRTETKDSAPSRAQRLAQPGDVFFQTVRPYQKNNYLFSKLDNNYVFSTGYAQMRPNIDTAFLMSFLQTDSFVKIVLDNCTGTSYPAINSSDLSNLEISLPKSFEEQKKVGKTIISIDNLITLHRRAYYNKKGGLTNVHNDNQQYYAIL